MLVGGENIELYQQRHENMKISWRGLKRGTDSRDKPSARLDIHCSLVAANPQSVAACRCQPARVSMEHVRTHSNRRDCRKGSSQKIDETGKSPTLAFCCSLCWVRAGSAACRHDWRLQMVNSPERLISKPWSEIVSANSPSSTGSCACRFLSLARVASSWRAGFWRRPLGLACGWPLLVCE
jgi:hypothetical protein